MGKNVFANGKEIVAKASDCKVVAAMPDVCLSPPPPPAGPAPIPYPDSSFAKDLKDGSKAVDIGGQPVALQDKSYYKSSPLGDEASTKNFGANVIDHTNAGKTFNAAFSMDVNVEGKGVPRAMDMATSNHSSNQPPGNPTGVNMGSLADLRDERIKEEKCPCCGKAGGEGGCPAAFKPDDVPLTMEQYYGTTRARAAHLAFLVDYKRAHCTCAPGNKVLPQPPCDRFRAPDEARYKNIVAAWEAEGVKKAYRAWYQAEFGTMLLNSTAILAGLIAASPNPQAIQKLANLRRGDPARKPYDALSDRAKKLERINHVVPKEAGGCPTGPGNLQPQQALCSSCQDIDQSFTNNLQ